MDRRLSLALALLLGAAFPGFADVPPIPPAIVAAVAGQARPAADVASDADRKPAELLAFAGVKPGAKVADFLPGGGYFTRLFSAVVGSGGHVYAVVPESLARAKPAALEGMQALVADPAYRNTSLLIRPYRDVGAGEPLDLVWTSQNYHDVYGEVSVFVEPGTSGRTAAEQLDASVFKALRSGGTYIVVDHAARSGATGADAHALHRIDPAIVIRQVTAAGFVLEAQSALLANPQDDHTASVFAPEIKGHTDKFVLRFRKP